MSRPSGGLRGRSVRIICSWSGFRRIVGARCTKLVRQGVGANVHYIPVYHQPFYRQRGFSRMALPGAESYYGSALTLPLFPAMTEADVDRVVTAVESAVQTEAAA